MMAEMGRLPANGLPAMTVGAPNFALVDLRLEVREGMFEVGEGNHPFPSLRPDVVELQDQDVRLPAIEARRVAEVVQQETEVSPLKRPVSRNASLEIHAPRSTGAHVGAPAMAARADDLAACDLGLDSCEGVPLMYEVGDPGSLLPDVVELQHEGVRQPAVRAAGAGKKVQHVAPRLRAPSFAGSASLLKVQLPPRSHVPGATLLARVLAFVEIRERQKGAAASTAPLLDRRGGRCRQRSYGRLWGIDPTGPQARRAKRYAELARDRSQRQPLRTELPRQALFCGLAGCHTNICSLAPRTVE
jgi:hypothetical protein